MSRRERRSASDAAAAVLAGRSKEGLITMLSDRAVKRMRSLVAIAAAGSVLSCGPAWNYPAPAMTSDEIVVNTAEFTPEVPRFYTYRTRGRNVNFFVIEIDGRVLSFLDACVNCYPRKQGYRFGNGIVTCRACDTSYSVQNLEHGVGGCVPIRFEGKKENGRYIISRAGLDRHAGKF
jgi:uncharacterized membrane protein